MSNWFAFHHITRQDGRLRKKKDLFKFGIISVVLIITGIGLVYHLLAARGIKPLVVSHSTHLGTLPVGYFSPSVLYWDKEIQAWAETSDLDPLLIATVVQIESCGNPHAVSPVGAQGLFQVMPYHFLPGENMLDPQTNAKRGLEYLRASLIKSNGNIERALAGYNGGHGQINRSPNLWPEETKRYVHWGWGIYQDALFSNQQGKTLFNWLKAGGMQLCQDAEFDLGLP